jgi:hypothetical protein
MKKRQIRDSIVLRLSEAMDLRWDGEPPGHSITALAQLANVSYQTARAWVEAEAEAGRLMVEEEARGYRVRRARNDQAAF